MNVREIIYDILSRYEINGRDEVEVDITDDLLERLDIYIKQGENGKDV